MTYTIQAFVMYSKQAMPTNDIANTASSPDAAALVMLSIFMLGAFFVVVAMLAQRFMRKQNKPTKLQQETRARIVAARHKHLSEHEGN